MRHRTANDLPGRCRRCYQRLPFCLCGKVEQVHTRTRFVILRHHREEPKSTGTARAAALALPNLEIRTYGDGERPVDTAGLDLPGTWLLYPENGAPRVDPPQPPPSQVVVLDGTWLQSRKMFRKLKPLHGLPKLFLAPRAQGILRLREPHFAEGMSTLEAIARTVALLEGEALAAPLDRLHTLWVNRCLMGRGRKLAPEDDQPKSP